MTFTLGIFDLFTYAIPGSMHLSLYVYLATRFGWLDLAQVTKYPTLALAVGFAVTAYVLGHCTYGLGVLLDRVSPLWRRKGGRSREEFMLRNPAARDRPYLQASHALLQSAAELADRETAAEITRLRAVGLMLRNASVPMLLGLVVAVVEAFVGPRHLFAVAVAALLVAAIVGASVQSLGLRRWADLKTLELCYWIPDIDERVARGGRAG